MKQKKLVRVIDYSPDHLTHMDVRDYEGFGIMTMRNFEADMTRLADKSVLVKTCVISGQILCVSGGLELMPGVLEVWMIPSKIVSRHVRAFAQHFKQAITALAAEGDYHRIQTSCPDDELHNRWLSWLGFEKEGVMRKLVKGHEDYAMYAKVR